MNVGRLRAALLAPPAVPRIAALVVLVSLRIPWGFVVDDALVSASFAHVVRVTGRHAFTVGAPAVDGVTPLVVPWLFAPFASSTLAAFEAQRLAGFAATGGAMVLLATALARRVSWAALVGVALAAGAFPLAAHAGSGLETGVAAGGVAVALALALEGQPVRASAVLGFVAILRPEFVVAASVGALALSSPECRVVGLVAASVPALVVAALRVAVFGSPFPLAVLAKPTDVAHGAVYVAAGLVVTNVWAIAPLAKGAFAGRSADERSGLRTAVAVAASHALTVLAVGGDWMPYSRLLVPVIPCVTVLGAFARGVVIRAAVLALCVAAQAAFGWTHAPAARAVADDRLRVIESLAPALRDARTVAGLDVGFLAASHQGAIVDLAGLTDPEVARLRGGHTSKAIPEGFLDARAADALVLWAPAGSVAELGPGALFGRVVETRIARSPSVRASFTEFARVPWGDSGAVLVVYRRRPR